MAGFIQRTRNGASLSSMLPPSNPEHLKCLQQAQERAEKTGDFSMVGGEHGIYIGVPKAQAAQGKGPQKQGR